MPRTAEALLSSEPSRRTLQRIGVDTQITCIRGELALLGDVMRLSPADLRARLARIRARVETAERHLVGRDG